MLQLFTDGIQLVFSGKTKFRNSCLNDLGKFSAKNHVRGNSWHTNQIISEFKLGKTKVICKSIIYERIIKCEFADCLFEILIENMP